MGSRAVLVAVETYQAGSTWELDGPVRDVLAHRAWLLGQGVAPGAITVLVAPLRHNRELLRDAGVDWREASRENVHQVLFREVAEESGDWLFVAWSGHGLVDLDGHRRLLYSDAAPGDLRSLDLEAALAAFRSDVAPGHPRQLWVVDTCQTFVDTATAAYALRPDPVPRGRLRHTPGQRALFACGPGGSAANRRAEARERSEPGGDGRTVRASSAFSTAVLDLLGAHPEWATDTASLTAALRTEFRSGVRRPDAQAPTSLWFDDAGRSTRTEVARAPARRRPSLADQRRLYDALAAVPVMQDPGLRAAVIMRLPSEICSSVPRSPVMRIEILELLGTCTLFENGLGHLWAAVSLLDAGTLALDELESVLREFPQWYSGAPDADPGEAHGLGHRAE
ncbi:effector-associated domain 2-containing protein [Streptomyces diastatochromogenes]|uniref:effector-associated domain 2-containing protein n=1 Tax=Streptomyces diastatochromogenes TaxID=42236 RepID=UPI003696AE76